MQTVASVRSFCFFFFSFFFLEFSTNQDRVFNLTEVFFPIFFILFNWEKLSLHYENTNHEDGDLNDRKDRICLRLSA